MIEVRQHDVRVGPFVDDLTYREFKMKLLGRGWTIQWALSTFIRMVAKMKPQELEALAEAMEAYRYDHPARREGPRTLKGV